MVTVKPVGKMTDETGRTIDLYDAADFETIIANIEEAEFKGYPLYTKEKKNWDKESYYWAGKILDRQAAEGLYD